MRPHHPHTPFVLIRQAAVHARTLHLYLQAGDLRPARSESDLASFLGRPDVGAFGSYEGERLVGSAACVVDETAAHLAWLCVNDGRREVAAALLAAVEKFARGRAAALVFARVPKHSHLCQWLAAFGFTADFEEDEVVCGAALTEIELAKPLS
jgi:hypothetical protein